MAIRRCRSKGHTFNDNLHPVNHLCGGAYEGINLNKQLKAIKSSKCENS